MSNYGFMQMIGPFKANDLIFSVNVGNKTEVVNKLSIQSEPFHKFKVNNQDIMVDNNGFFEVTNVPIKSITAQQDENAHTKIDIFYDRKGKKPWEKMQNQLYNK